MCSNDEQNIGNNRCCKNGSLQGSLFVKHLLKTFFGHDDSAIAKQVDWVRDVLGFYTTVIDFHQFLELVTTGCKIYNKLDQQFTTFQSLTFIQSLGMIMPWYHERSTYGSFQNCLWSTVGRPKKRQTQRKTNVNSLVARFFQLSKLEYLQRQTKINKGKKMLNNCQIEKNQKITTGSISSETTCPPSPELTDKQSRTVV